jgi:hypothetical protein
MTFGVALLGLKVEFNHITSASIIYAYVTKLIKYLNPETW